MVDTVLQFGYVEVGLGKEIGTGVVFSDNEPLLEDVNNRGEEVVKDDKVDGTSIEQHHNFCGYLNAGNYEHSRTEGKCKLILGSFSYSGGGVNAHSQQEAH